MDSLFTNISILPIFKETITISMESIYDQNDIAEGLNKFELKKLLPLSTKESYFIFNEFLCKQIDGIAMGSPLGSTLDKAFL